MASTTINARFSSAVRGVLAGACAPTETIRDYPYSGPAIIRPGRCHPSSGEVCNPGGGRDDSCSILEAFTLVSEFSGENRFTPIGKRTGSVTRSAATAICPG